jgi:tetratricopeptide (TPR) repeat protein
MNRSLFRSITVALVVLATAPTPGLADTSSDMAVCADERVKASLLPAATLSAAELACGRVLEGDASGADRQRAAFFRSLMRFLQIVQKGAELKPGRGGAPGVHQAPTTDEVAPALADVETAIALEGPMRGDALALRVTINQVLGRSQDARADLDRAMHLSPRDPTPFVQRALEHERAGDVEAALADLDRALDLDPKAGTALAARANLLRRLGLLTRARADYLALAAAGPPFRRIALSFKSDVELRVGDVGAAYEDLLAAARESGDMPEAAPAKLDLLLRAGDLALDKLKLPDIAEQHFREAAQLLPGDWRATLGLARIEERRGDAAKAMAIYKRILSATKATPRLVERLVATIRLRALTEPLLRATGPFRDATTGDVKPSAASPDGLKRVAFVIGEGDYANLASLPNARRDATVMANALAEMGFNVVKLGENLGKGDLRRVPALVAELAAQSDVALVFYAGHAVETAGVNYLLPVDAAPESDRDLQNDALALADLTAAASKARRGALVVVDACRDDPFVEARAVAQSRGLAPQRAGSGHGRLHVGLAPTPSPAPNNVVFHSTQPGQAALDGDGLDSPFVRALLSTLGTPGKPLDAVVRETTARVSSQTQGRQVPAAYGVPPRVALLPPAGR